MVPHWSKAYPKGLDYSLKLCPDICSSYINRLSLPLIMCVCTRGHFLTSFAKNTKFFKNQPTLSPAVILMTSKKVQLLPIFHLHYLPRILHICFDRFEDILSCYDDFFRSNQHMTTKYSIHPHWMTQKVINRYTN